MGIFDSVRLEKVKGSTFNLSHQVKTSYDLGELVPTCLMEVLPGDDFKINVENMTRMPPLITPVYHNIDITTHFFFVPNRILWDEWEDFITGASTPVPPYVNITSTLQDKDLGSYMGYRSQDNEHQSALPIAAYNKIFDDYYRAQHIDTSERFTILDAGEEITYRTNLYGGPYKRAWQHDYFTSALPSPQLGSAVDLPLLSGDDAPVTIVTGLATEGVFRKASDDTLSGSGTVASAGTGQLEVNSINSYYDPLGTLEVDISGETTDINTLREAFALQRWLEKEMRAGTRYVEHNLAFFGVKSSDQRLNRAEYIGGAKQQMVISEVLTTAITTNNPVGNMAGHAISTGSGASFRYKAEEHGWILGITSALPKTGYYQGIDKHFVRKDRFDYANPMFANLGEQAVTNGELYVTPTDTQATLDGVFGYVPRFAEYKFINNKVCGEFLGDLEYWHMDRKFSSPPALNATFIECVHDNRNFAAIEGSNTVYSMIYNNVYCYRKLPKYGIPSIVG